MSSVTQTCTTCGQTKPLDDQHWRRDKKFNSWRRQCLECYRKEDRERYHARKPQPKQYTAETPREQSLALVPENVHLLIDVESQRVSLTSMWRASGAGERQAPGDWLQTESAQAFVSALAETEYASNVLETRRGGTGSGTWAHWQVGVEYARYLSPAFAIRWNNYARAYLEGRPRPAEPIAPPAPSDDTVVDFAAELYRLAGRFLEANKQREQAKAAMLGRVAAAPIAPTGMQIADPRQAGYVYVLEKIGARPPQYKIGFTQDENIDHRQRDVEGQSGIVTRRLHTIHSDEAERLERKIHAYYRRKRVKGEWFMLTEQDVSALCNLPQFIRYADFSTDALATVVVVQGSLL